MKHIFPYIYTLLLFPTALAQKNENRIIHINGDDTLVVELEGVMGNIDSVIEESLKSFYKLGEISELRNFGRSIDSLITEDFEVKIGVNEQTDNHDSIKIKLGNMKILIIDNKDKSSKGGHEEKRKVIIDKEIRMDRFEDSYTEEDGYNRSNKKIKVFKPESYWSGLSYGSNGMLNSSGNFTTSSDAPFLKFDYLKSYEVQFNMLENRFPVFKNHIGVTTGLGFKWNRFTLENNAIDINYNDTVLYSSSSNQSYKRSTLRVSFLQAPILVEFCSNKDPKKAWHLSVGMVGGLRLGSSWRTKAGNNVNNTKGDFNFRPFTAQAVAILGYDNVSILLNYGLSNLFESNTAPATKLVSAGIMMHF